MDGKKLLAPKSNSSLLPSPRGLAPVPANHTRKNSLTPNPDGEERPATELRKRSLDGVSLTPLPSRTSPDKGVVPEIKPLGSPLDRSPAIASSSSSAAAAPSPLVSPLPLAAAAAAAAASGASGGVVPAALPLSAAAAVSGAAPVAIPLLPPSSLGTLSAAAAGQQQLPPQPVSPTAAAAATAAMTVLPPFRSTSPTPLSSGGTGLPSSTFRAPPLSARRNSDLLSSSGDNDLSSLSVEERSQKYRLDRDLLKRTTEEQAEQIRQLTTELDNQKVQAKAFQSKFQAAQEALVLRDNGQAQQMTALKTERDNLRRLMQQKEQQNQQLQLEIQQLQHEQQQSKRQLQQLQQQLARDNRTAAPSKKNPVGDTEVTNSSFFDQKRIGLVSLDSEDASALVDVDDASPPSVESLGVQHGILQRQLQEALAEMKRLKLQLRNRMLATDIRQTGGAFQVDSKSSTTAPMNKLALVFTDVEHSTAMWEVESQTMTVCLGLHNAIIRSAIDEFGGYEVKTEGDAFMIAFSDTLNAINFCLAVQERLVSADWPDDFEAFKVAGLAPDVKDASGKLLFSGLRVRMGVHTGVPICQEDPHTKRMDYLGRMVNKAARITGLCQAGQILVSTDVLSEVKSAVAHKAFIKSLGLRRLRGIKEDTELIQLLPLSLAGRQFNTVVEQDLVFVNQSMSNQLDSLLSEHDELKRRFSMLEQRLVQLDVEAVEFAAKLETLRVTTDDNKTPDELSLIERIAKDFDALQRKQADTSLLFQEMNNQRADFSLRISTISDHFERISAKEAEKEKEDADRRNSSEQPVSYGALSKKLKNVEQQLGDVSSERASLLAKVKALDEDAATNKKKIVEARHQVLTMKTLLQAKSSQIDSLKAENDDLVAELRSANYRLAQVQASAAYATPPPTHHKNPMSVSSQSSSFSMQAVKPGTPAGAADYLVINRIR